MTLVTLDTRDTAPCVRTTLKELNELPLNPYID